MFSNPHSATRSDFSCTLQTRLMLWSVSLLLLLDDDAAMLAFIFCQ